MDDRIILEDDERRMVAAIFRWGLSLSSVAMVAGLLLDLTGHSATMEPIDLAHLEDMSLPTVLMAVGIGILAVTPAINIGALMFLWGCRGEFKLTLIALIVMVTLVAGILVGQA